MEEMTNLIKMFIGYDKDDNPNSPILAMNKYNEWKLENMSKFVIVKFPDAWDSSQPYATGVIYSDRYESYPTGKDHDKSTYTAIGKKGLDDQPVK